MKKPPRQFRPTPPRLRESWPVIVFGLLTIMAAAGWIRERTIAPLLVSLAMTLLGSWFYYRQRVFGSPTLDVDSKGFCYRIGKREFRGKWAEVADMQWDFYRHEIRIVRHNGLSPIPVNIDMTTRTGERFDMVFQDYWKPPKR